MEELINSFMTIGSGWGTGTGYGNGYGNGDGDGDGSGYGNGDGDGDGWGFGYGTGYGYGYGYGNGYGNGDGDGDGKGWGFGYGYGYGDGKGSGCGCGDGCGYGYGDGKVSLLSISKVGNDSIYTIDGVPTAIDHVRGNIAQCRILQADMTWRPCFVVRIGDNYAHGETIHDAQRDAMQKHMQSSPIEERLQMFKDRFPDYDEHVPAKELFDWHNILTGSCLFGRQQWCKDHGIDIEHDTCSPRRFIELTQDSYGGDTIKKLYQLYNQNKSLC